MRLARLAATGLAIGVIAGFAIALLRPRPRTSLTPSNPPAPFPESAADDPWWDQFGRAEASSASKVPSRPRVT
jgi:hypothetical protein